MIIICYTKQVLLKISQYSRQNSRERLLLVLLRIYLFAPGCKVIFCEIDCKSVFKVLSISTEMHFSTDLALMSTHPLTLTFIYTLSTLFTFILHLHFFIQILFHHIGQFTFGFAKSFMHVVLSSSLHYKKVLVLQVQII